MTMLNRLCGPVETRCKSSTDNIDSIGYVGSKTLWAMKTALSADTQTVLWEVISRIALHV
jgi:hypothetical protein